MFKKEVRMPMQPIERIGKTIGFRKNKIVRWILDNGPFDMDVIHMIPDVTDDEKTQFAQLIGYSIYGAGHLSYFDEETYEKACEIAKEMIEKKKK